MLWGLFLPPFLWELCLPTWNGPFPQCRHSHHCLGDTTAWCLTLSQSSPCSSHCIRKERRDQWGKNQISCFFTAHTHFMKPHHQAILAARSLIHSTDLDAKSFKARGHILSILIAQRLDWEYSNVCQIIKWMDALCSNPHLQVCFLSIILENSFHFHPGDKRSQSLRTVLLTSLTLARWGGGENSDPSASWVAISPPAVTQLSNTGAEGKTQRGKKSWHSPGTIRRLDWLAGVEGGTILRVECGEFYLPLHGVPHGPSLHLLEKRHRWETEGKMGCWGREVGRARDARTQWKGWEW